MAPPLRAQSAGATDLPKAGIRLDSGRVTVVADQRDARLAKSMLVEAVSQDTFPGLPRAKSHILIAIAPDAQTFRSWVGPSAPEWGAAVAIPAEQRIVMQGSFAASEAGNPTEVLRHELAHLALHEFMKDLPQRWFDEGYASVAAGEFSRSAAFETSFGMAWRTLPNVEALEAGFAGGATRAQWTYAISHLAVDELREIDPQQGLANFFAAWKASGSYDKALRSAFGLTSDGFDNYWHKKVRVRYGAFAFAADLSAVFALFALMLGPLVWARKRRDKRRLEAMRKADAVQEAAARRSTLEALATLGIEGSSAEEILAQAEAGSLDTNSGHP